MYAGHASRRWAIGLILCAGVDASGADHDDRRADVDAAATPITTLWSQPGRVSVATAPPTEGAQPFSVFLTTNNDPEGDMPRAVAFTPDGSTAVIVHRDTDNIAFFDVASRTVTHTVAVQDFPVHVTVTPDGRYVVVPNVLSHSVSVVDIAAHAVAAHIPITGQQPFRVAVTSDSRTAVVAVINDGVNSAFSIIDLALMAEVMTIPSTPQGVIGAFFNPEAGISGNLYTSFALSPDDHTVVLPDRVAGRVTLYDLTDGSETASLPTGDVPTAVDISGDGGIAVVSHEGGEQRITKINLLTHTVDDSFLTRDDLTSQVIRITPDNSHAIAAISNNVIFVNLTTGMTTATLMTGTVGDIALSFDGQYAFVSNFNARVIDIASQTVVRTIPFAPCAEAAASPVALRAVALNNRFAEDIQVYNINGPSGSFEGFALTGAPPEADATRTLAVSSDGGTLVAANNTSRNVAIIDVAAGQVRAYVNTGKRILDVAVTPDGTHAVVANGDADTVSVIDLATDMEVANLPVFQRPARVRVSPDSATAYVLTVAGSDRIHFIALNGANSAEFASVLSGQTGSALGYPFTEISGIELSPDGSILAVCVSFDDKLRLIDTAAHSVLTDVPVGDFPIRVVFSPDGGSAYVANAFGNSISVVSIDGAASAQVAVVPGAALPLTMDVDADGAFVYVGTFGSGSQPMRVLNTATNAFVQSLSLSGFRPRATHLSTADSILYAAGVGSGESALLRVHAAGAASSLIDAIPVSSTPSDMVFSPALRTAIVAQPIPDGVDLVTFGTPGDFDADGDVDLDDFAAYLDCVSGPDPENLPPACAVFDFDDDDDADLADLAPLQIMFQPG